jgi:hypothetical protein
VKEEIDKIQTALLNNLCDDLKIKHPEFVKKLEQGKPENFYNFQEAKDILDKPIEPWTELLSSFLDFELGFDFCKLTVEKMSTTKNDRELHFYIRTYSIYLNATLERLEHFTKKLQRKRVIVGAENILKFIYEAIQHPGLKQERHTAAHGRFTGTKKPIADVQTECYWEPYAVIRLDESHLDEWHKAQGNNRKSLVDFTKLEFDDFSNSLRNVLRNINDLLKYGNRS